MNIFYALAEPTRLNIIEMLAARGKLAASEISENFQVSAPAISQHLKVLRQSNLVVVEKHGQQRLYQINPDAMLQLEEWVNKMKSMWEKRFTKLDKLLEKTKSDI